MLRELKAKKAKFGFALDGVGINYFIPLGKMLESLQNTYATTDYMTQMVGMHGNDFRLYTDNAEIAKFIRVSWCNQI